MLKTIPGSINGFQVKSFIKGKNYKVNELNKHLLVDIFVNSLGAATIIEEEKLVVKPQEEKAVEPKKEEKAEPVTYENKAQSNKGKRKN